MMFPENYNAILQMFSLAKVLLTQLQCYIYPTFQKCQAQFLFVYFRLIVSAENFFILSTLSGRQNLKTPFLN